MAPSRVTTTRSRIVPPVTDGKFISQHYGKIRNLFNPLLDFHSLLTKTCQIAEASEQHRIVLKGIVEVFID